MANDPAAVDPFVDYYEQQSSNPRTIAQFSTLKFNLLRMLGRADARGVRVADIGCGAGTFCRIWAAEGATVGGIDVNPALVQIAEQRARFDGLVIDFRTGLASALPWPDESFDLVVMPELLEHVADWGQCLREAVRVLDSGGLLYLSTTNRLCPKQQEFDLPMYSWYPRSVKERCLARARTDRRQWVSHAEFPAIHWFDPYLLARELERLGMQAFDRFQIWSQFSPSGTRKTVGRIAVGLPPVRFIGHMLTPYTLVIGRKLPN